MNHVTFQSDLLMKKVLKIFRRKPAEILRGFKAMCTPKQRTLQVFYTDIKAADPVLTEGVEQWGKSVRIEILRAGQRHYVPNLVLSRAGARKTVRSLQPL